MVCPTPTDRSQSHSTRSKPNCPVVGDQGIAYNTRSRARDLSHQRRDFIGVFENQMSQPKLEFKRIFPIIALTFVDILGLTIILPLLHLYAARFGASPLLIGVTAAAFPAAQLLGAPIMGALSDRYGRKPLLLISQATTFASFIMLGAASSLGMVIFSRVFDGLFGANISTARAAVSDVTTKNTRTQGLGLIGAAFGVGFIVGPVISLAALEFTDNLGIPAYIAASYSAVSILITLFGFEETHPKEKRAGKAQGATTQLRDFRKALSAPGLRVLYVIMFAQQFVFFGFESLLGLFTLTRLGMLGQGNAILFLFVGGILVAVQGRYIGRWSYRWGERNLVIGAIGLLAVGFFLTATTPQSPHPFYVERIVENELANTDSERATEAVLGEIRVDLPDEADRGVTGVLWILVALAPISVGAGLIRPTLNSLITMRVSEEDYGAALGVSAACVSAANAAAPLAGGLVFQSYGATAPFLLGGIAMTLIFVVSVRALAAQPLAPSERVAHGD